MMLIDGDARHGQEGEFSLILLVRTLAYANDRLLYTACASS